MAGELEEFYPHNFVSNYDKYSVSDGKDFHRFAYSISSFSSFMDRTINDLYQDPDHLNHRL